MIPIPDRSPFHVAAQEMFELEHTRWNHHMLLFFGIVTALIAGSQDAINVISPRWAMGLAAVVSVLWLCAIQCNRASSYAWAETIRRIEDSPDQAKPFSLYQEKRNEFPIFRDYLANFGYGELPGGKLRNMFFAAVTRVYALLATIMALAFFVLSFVVK